MQVLADTVPNGNGRTLLFPGLGHVPHLERPDIIVPALVEYLMEGVE
jgi:pimeloyl-ACP methyl ester carboxylesterase